MDRTTSCRTATVRCRTALLAASGIALVFAAAPHDAAAQAFQGNGTVPTGAGGATITPGFNSTTIDVTSPNTVINWTPTDTSGPAVIDFLPAGTTATFRSDLQDYTVLNRILPTTVSAIGLNGTIQSTAFVPTNEGQGTGGNVWFYTPYGFVIGNNATINVGGLILTTNDVLYSLDAASGQANFLDANGAINFRGAADSKSAVINNSLTSTGISSSSYVAFVAPRIEQRGKVTADRSIAYIAGETVDLKINAGTFDIAVLTGTTDAEGIVHTGSTTGSQSTGYFDTKAISMVAIPKNDALTMMLSGNIGYVQAASLYDDGSAIVLTAGDEGSPTANIHIGQGEFTNRVSALATGDLTIAPDDPGPQSQGTTDTIFRSFSDLTGEQSVHLTAASGTRIRADQGLSLYTGSETAAGTIDIEALAGVQASNGEISVSSYLDAYASHYGGTSEDGNTGLDAQGGTITLHANGGIIAADYLYLAAGGYGGQGALVGGIGTGGTIDLAAGNGGTISAFYASLHAPGDGGQGYAYVNDMPLAGQGGVGRGGTIHIADSLGDAATDPLGGALNMGSLYLDASGAGGNSFDFGVGLGGDAFGGSIAIMLDRHNQSLSGIYASANAYDGDAGYDPIGGDITMTVGGGITVALSELDIYANAYAGVNGPAGAFGKGGTVDLSVGEGASLLIDNGLYVSARAENAYFFGTPDRTADLTGGDVTISADNGLIESLFVNIDVGAYNVGATTSAGFAHGGTVNATASNGGSFGTRAPDAESFPEFNILAEAYSAAGDVTGESRGGAITLAALNGGAITAPFTSINLDASGETGIVNEGGATGAPAHGGTIAIDAIGGSIGAPVFAYANGLGGEADFDAGSGTGGSIALRVLDGGTFASTLTASATGIGGQSFVSGNGGDGTGGRFSMLTNASAMLPAFSLDFQGYGQGGVATTGTSGDAFGGSAQIDILGGKHTWTNAYLDIGAFGGESVGIDSVAGSAFGSDQGTLFHVGGASLTISNGLTIDGRSYAGHNGGANRAVGNSLSLLVDSGATLTAGYIDLDVSGSLTDSEFDPRFAETSPTASGGSVSVIANGGTISTPYLSAHADGETAGALTSAGEAHGGTAMIGAANGGALRIEGSSEGVGLYVSADGLGAEGPSAAHAFGGTATLFANGGTVTSPYDLEITADGRDGNYSGYFYEYSIPSNGFNATGGIATVAMSPGVSGSGSIEVPSLYVSAQGLADRAIPAEGSGGSGTGGTATLDVAAGTLTIDYYLGIMANGYGGSADENAAGSDAFASGDGVGGNANLLLSGGSIIAPAISIEAQGYGARGIGRTEGAIPSYAGHGYGGNATFSATGGSLDNTGFGVESQFYLTANGFGGSGAYNPNPGIGGAGGFGVGGVALFEAPAGSTASLAIAPYIDVVADGYGGVAGASATEGPGMGGDGFGGSALMALADISFNFGYLGISASGYGGPAGFLLSEGQFLSNIAPGAVGSGAGNGGTAGFELTDSGPVTADREIAQLSIAARGTDFTGLNPNGDGGATRFVADVGGAGAALAIGGDLLLDARGIGAPGGYGFSGSISGAPVTVGGAATILTPRDAILTIVDPGAMAITGDLTIDVGRTFTSTGAISTLANASVVAPEGISMTDLSAGGTTLLQALNGPVTVSHDLMSGGLVTVLGTMVDLKSLGALSFADADATAGSLSIQTEGDLDLTTVDATGAVTLVSNSGTVHNTGAINGTDLTFIAGVDVISDTAISANGNLAVDAGGVFLTPTDSASATGNVSLSADLGLDLASVVSGGTTLLQAAMGTVAVASLTSPGAVTALGQSVSIASPGGLMFASARATAGDLAIQTAGNLALSGASATGTLGLTSTAGAVTASGPVSAGGNTAVSGNTGVTLGTLTSGGTTALSAIDGAIAVTDLRSTGAATATGRSISIGSTGALSVTSAQATAGNLAITTAQTLNVGTASATGTVMLTAGGNLATTGPLGGAGITLGGSNVSLAGPVNSSVALNITAQQLLTVSALATGTTITATSGDIAIGATGRIGSRGLTRTVTMTNGSSSAPIAVGGTGTAGQYSLDKAEAARLFADQTITVAGGSSDIGVGDLAMSFGSAGTANIDSGGTLKIDTTGNVSVSGAVALTTSSADDTFSIDPQRIDVIAGAGSIAMLGASGTPLGALVLDGGTITVASQQAIDAIGSATSFAAIVALLDQPGPSGPTGGYLQAGEIDVRVESGFYVQNAGTGTAYDDRRGFSAQTLSIDTGTGSPQISINGVILGPTGTITGLPVAPKVMIDGLAATDYGRTPFPTINGCAVNVDCARPDFPGQSRSDLEQPLSSDGTTQSSYSERGDGNLLLPGNGLVSLSSTQPLIAPPLVDEPITGVGNDDFWQVHCEAGDDGAECPSGDGEK